MNVFHFRMKTHDKISYFSEATRVQTCVMCSFSVPLLPMGENFGIGYCRLPKALLRPEDYCFFARRRTNRLIMFYRTDSELFFLRGTLHSSYGMIQEKDRMLRQCRHVRYFRCGKIKDTVTEMGKVWSAVFTFPTFTAKWASEVWDCELQAGSHTHITAISLRRASQNHER